MSRTEELPGPATLSIRNVGGIDSSTVEFRPGVTVLEGRNASNRTSLLQALAGALGSDQVSLKADADEGSVALEFDGETYTRRLERTEDGIARTGEPFLSDSVAADLFAFLFGSNAAREAVRRGGDLRELIMRPIDTEALRAERERLGREKARIDEELSAIEDLADDLPRLESERRELRERIDEKRSALDSARERLDELDADAEATKEVKAELEETLAELADARSDLESVAYESETQRESLASLRDQRDSLDADLDRLPTVDEGAVDRIEGEIARLQDRKQSVTATINRLQQIAQFNEDVLDGDATTLLDGLVTSERSVTDDLLGDERTMVCWTCGSEVDRSAIDETLDALRELRRTKVEERKDIDDELSSLRSELDDVEETRAERERIEERLREVDREVDRRENLLETKRERREAIKDRIDDLETRVEELREHDIDAVLEQQRAVSQLSFDLDNLESELADVDEEIDRIESRLADRETLRAERESTQESLESVRSRVDDLEASAVEAFNEHMATVLSVLDYENVERVWIERTEQAGRGEHSTRQFTLNVVRDTTDGTVYEDTVDHLSESEREVIGLVFALAGYLAHEVYEQLPFVLLDSIEAIDAQRIDALLSYFGEQTSYLVVALLPEDAAAVDATHRIESI